jgi:hypothetical protein
LLPSFHPTESALPGWSVAPPLLNPELDSRSVFQAQPPASEGGFVTLAAATAVRSSSGGEPFSLVRYVTSTTDEWSAAPDAYVRHDDRVDVLQDPLVGSLPTADGGELKTARDIRRDEPLAQLDDSFDRTRLSVLEEATEGGLVDIDELLETTAITSGRPASSKPGSADKPAWDSARRNLLPSGTQDSAYRRRTGQRVDPATGERSHGQSGERGGSHDAPKLAGRARTVDEGGMIALVATANPRDDWSSANPSAPLAAGPRELVLPPGSGGIRMDAGIGLFQAFELATTPVQVGAPHSAASESAGATKAAASSATGGKSSSERSASTYGELTPNRAATIPAVLIVSCLLNASSRPTNPAERRSSPVGC